MKKINIPLWVKILVWTPLGLFLYPKYYWKLDNPQWFQVLNAITIVIEFYIIFNLIFR